MDFFVAHISCVRSDKTSTFFPSLNDEDKATTVSLTHVQTHYRTRPPFFPKCFQKDVKQNFRFVLFFFSGAFTRTVSRHSCPKHDAPAALQVEAVEDAKETQRKKRDGGGRCAEGHFVPICWCRSTKGDVLARVGNADRRQSSRDEPNAGYRAERRAKINEALGAGRRGPTPRAS